ncbi:MAG TPA: hypothetical protein VH681_12790 [Nitrospiraceae bacterium]|jgi:hypothetical protein
MHTPAYEMNLWKWATIISTLLSMTLVLEPLAQAADEIAGRNVGHTQKVEMMEVGDVPAHFLGVSQYNGLTFYTKGPEKGEIASRMGTTIFDVVKGKGTLTGHEVKTFKDGSTLFLKWGGTQWPIDGGKRTAYEGTWEVTGGTGRYAGSKGSGTFKGERIGDFKTGADNYIDVIGTEWK